MEFSILYAIQSIHTNLLDSIVLFLTNMTGNYGQIWLVVAAILLIFRKTRKCGICVLVSYGLVYLIGQYVLKDLVARPRPCHLDESVQLLISRPGSYSFPSTHSAWACAAAVSILYYFRKSGIAVLVFALIIGFSRMYLFVHFPSDVLVGFVMGALLAFGTCKLADFVEEKCIKKKATQKVPESNSASNQ